MVTHRSNVQKTQTGHHGGLRRGTAAAALGVVLAFSAGAPASHAATGFPLPPPFRPRQTSLSLGLDGLIDGLLTPRSPHAEPLAVQPLAAAHRPPRTPDEPEPEPSSPEAVDPSPGPPRPAAPYPTGVGTPPAVRRPPGRRPAAPPRPAGSSAAGGPPVRRHRAGPGSRHRQRGRRPGRRPRPAPSAGPWQRPRRERRVDAGHGRCRPDQPRPAPQRRRPSPAPAAPRWRRRQPGNRPAPPPLLGWASASWHCPLVAGVVVLRMRRV